LSARIGRLRLHRFQLFVDAATFSHGHATLTTP
jgi:hypothetical protein